MISSDMSEYFSDKDQIKILEEIIRDLECSNIAIRKKLKLSQGNSSKLKKKYQQMNDAHNEQTVTRRKNAMTLIANRFNGEVKITLGDIAKKCFLTYQYVRYLSNDYNKKKLLLVRGDL